MDGCGLCCGIFELNGWLVEGDIGMVLVLVEVRIVEGACGCLDVFGGGGGVCGRGVRNGIWG